LPTPNLAEWDYALPDEAIANVPPVRRDGGRLLVLDGDAPARHETMAAVPELVGPGDVIVVNDSRVMPARLRARRATGGAVELLVLQPGPGDVDALCRPARRLRAGDMLRVGEQAIEVLAAPVDGIARLRFADDPASVLEAHGEVPLPPYLHRRPRPEDRERYQTVYAAANGSVAAPTAGLHFTPALLDAVRLRGAQVVTVTLHVGPGTFRPVAQAQLDASRLHAEPWALPEATATAIEGARRAGGRVIAIGTTATRVLETATPPGARVPEPGHGVTDLFLRPPQRPRCVDVLMTNFHLPRSSLLMLVGAFCGRERLLQTYAEALAKGYRFASYGDAMWVA
jgi:S-adenosylmethionine:tRNA ribosyltransferase-isomerase